MFYFADTNWGMWAVIVPASIFAIGLVVVSIGAYHRLGAVEKSLDNDVKPELKTLAGGISNILKMLAEKGLAHANSPRTLSEDGKKVLKSSGIDSIVDDKFDYIVKKVKALKPANPYQAEQAVLDVVADFKKDPALKDALEEGAFNSGYMVDSVLFVGALHIRDRVLKELGMKAEEIDKHAPKK